jgi:hypothetical protein
VFWETVPGFGSCAKTFAFVRVRITTTKILKQELTLENLHSMKGIYKLYAHTGCQVSAVFQELTKT